MEFPASIPSIIFVVLLIVPGVVLKRFYFQGEFTKEFGFGIFADRLFSSIFLGIIVQIVTFLFLAKVYGFTYENSKGQITQLYKAFIDADFKIISSENLWTALGYLIICLFTAAFLGGSAHHIVRQLRLDIRFPLLRFSNQWNYLFKGEIVHSKKFKAINKGKVLETYVDVVIDTEDNGKKKMVSGFLADYSISSKTGDLEAIYLIDAKRYSSSKAEFVKVEGECFVLPYNKVVDMNLTYVFKKIDASKFNQLLVNVFEYLSFFGFLAVCIRPWFLNERLFIKILVFFASFVGYLLLMAITSSFINSKKEAALKGVSLWVAVIIFLLSVVAILWLTGVI